MTRLHATRTAPAQPWRQVVDPGGIAAALGVEPATVRKWGARRLLPAPAYHRGRTPWWYLDDIESWARETGRLAS